MSAEEFGGAVLYEATAALRARGLDARTIAGLLLNGAAVLCLESHSEEEFAESARDMRRAAERQAELVALLDRVQKRRGLGVKPKGGRRTSPSGNAREGSTP